MKFVLLAAVLSLFSFQLRAAEPAKAAAIAVAESEAIVELVSVDRNARTAVVRQPNGSTATLKIPPEAQNLDRVKPGDLFRMRYVEAVALALHKGESASAQESQTVQLAPKGGTPGGVVVNTKQVSAVVTAVDRASRTIAVRGPNQGTMTLKVADEVKSFDEIGLGDTISLTYTEAIALRMISDKPPAAAPAKK